MSQDFNEQKVQDENQVLQETALNEKIITHPEFGQFKFHIPTLKDQQVIDNIVRAKKKSLKMAVDIIPDPTDTTKTITVPAYKSREVLRKEYRDLGWWTDENEVALTAATVAYTQAVFDLEAAGFDSEEVIYETLVELEDKLRTIFKEEMTSEIDEAISGVTSIGRNKPEYHELLRAEATSSDVDNLLEETNKCRTIFQKFQTFVATYTDYIQIQTEESELFADSWQSQIEQATRLAQVFVCITQEGTKIWKDFFELEASQTESRELWLINEFTYFVRGIPDEVRIRMSKYGFFSSPFVENESSEPLQEEEKSSPDGDSQEQPSKDSSPVTATKGRSRKRKQN